MCDVCVWGGGGRFGVIRGSYLLHASTLYTHTNTHTHTHKGLCEAKAAAAEQSGGCVCVRVCVCVCVQRGQVNTKHVNLCARCAGFGPDDGVVLLWSKSSYIIAIFYSSV